MVRVLPTPAIIFSLPTFHHGHLLPRYQHCRQRLRVHRRASADCRIAIWRSSGYRRRFKEALGDEICGNPEVVRICGEVKITEEDANAVGSLRTSMVSFQLSVRDSGHSSVKNKELLSINDTHHKLNCILLYTALVARNLNRKFSTPYIDKTIVMCQISQPLIACSIYKLCFSEGRVLAPLGLGGRAEKALDTPIAFISWFQQEAPQNL